MSLWILALSAAGAVAAVTILRFRAATGLPLWLDETFTAVIRGQPTFQDFLHEAHRDIGAPLYYLLMWLLPGNSNFALRLPSLVLMFCAAALPLVWRIPGQSTSAAITWGTLLLLWPAGGPIAFDARPYALVVFFATAQTIAFGRLIAGPSLRRALFWTGASALCISTHYFSGALGLAQGIVLLAILRQRALALWPALLLLVPSIVELVLHLPLILQFAEGPANWLPRFGPALILPVLLYVTGTAGPILLSVSCATRLLYRDEPVARAAIPPIVAGILAILLLFIAGWNRSLLVDRYFTACVPPVLLGFVTLAGGLLGRLILVGGFGWVAVHAALFEPMTVATLGLEAPSRYLIPTKPKRLVYSLGYPGQSTLAPEMRQQLGEFAFRRAGLNTRAELIETLGGANLVRAAGEDGAIIWILGSAAHLPEAEAIARSRPCVILRQPDSQMLACPALDWQASPHF